MLEQEIRNWCRWHWSAMRWHRHRCGSLEAQWRSPQPWYDIAPQAPAGRVDVLKAQAVEDCWRTLPNKSKLLLKWHYVFQLARTSILRKLRQRNLGVSANMFPVELEGAEYRLALALNSHYAIEFKPRYDKENSPLVC